MTGVAMALAGSGSTPRLTDRSVSAAATFPNNATAEIEFSASGGLNTIEDNGTGGVVTGRLPEWHGRSYAIEGAGTHYEIRCTVQSGNAPSSGSAIDTWLALTSAREWLLFRNSLGSSVGTWLIEIRPSSGAVIASATYTMTASKSSP